MKYISQEDWEALNAYSDGELPAADMIVLKARLKNEPALQETLVQIQDIGSALKIIRPKLDSEAMQAQKPKQIFGYFAIAVSVAIVFVFVEQVIFGFRSVLTPLDQHQAFLQQEFSVSYLDIQQASARNGVPDLTVANLSLVANVADEDENQSLHYAGRNGCRLTLTITKNHSPNFSATPELLLASWSNASHHYVLLATGMDANKFVAISKYIRIHFNDPNRKNTILAMREATQTAVPCAVG
ncbi:MAG: hypothetical protein HRU28_16850 [Rhizobiales bacterium]|nr:hypothetical protein [Hyphomicrobiales bacterium]